MSSESKTKPRERRRSSVHKHAKNASKLFDNLGKGISKSITAGVSKTKKFAIEKVVKMEATKETPQMMEMLGKLEAIKNSIDSLSDKTIPNLYSSQVKECIHSLQLSETFMSLRTCDTQQKTAQDLFQNFANNVMGRKLFKINTMTNEYLVKMEKELINPISIYKSKELSKIAKLLREYETIKRDYDFALHKYTKLVNKGGKSEKMSKKNKAKKQSNKISVANVKKNEKFNVLSGHRMKIMQCIADLEQKQQINLLNCFEKFWKSYTIFAQRNAQILSLKDGFDLKYDNQKQLCLSSSDETAETENENIFDEIDEQKNGDLRNLMRSQSLRVALSMHEDGNHELSKEKRYKNWLKLGSGAFATVYKANDLLNEDREVAIKKICIGDGSNTLYLSSTKEESENELKILKSLRGHTNCIHLIDDYYEETVYNDLYLNLVMDYIPQTLLSQCEHFGESGETIPHNLIQIYAFQLIKAVNYLHCKKIMHRDIKPDNCLINTANHMLKLCDFGCSLKVEKRYNLDSDIENGFELADKFKDDLRAEKGGKLQSYVCSRFYRAPELILQSEFYDCFVDIWSLGCVISEMFLGTLLFEGYNNESEQLDDIIKKLGTPSEEDMDSMNCDYVYTEDVLDRDERGESWDMLFCAVIDMPQSAIELISKILVYDPNQRWTALKCLKCKYFEGLTEENEMCEELKLFEWSELEIAYSKANNVVL